MALFLSLLYQSQLQGTVEKLRKTALSSICDNTKYEALLQNINDDKILIQLSLY